MGERKYMTDAGGEPPPIEQCCELLTDAVRRHVLYCLLERDTATEDELVDAVSGWLADRSGDGGVTDTDRVSLTVELSHVHLPKLETAGVIERADDSCRLEECPETLQGLLSVTATYEETDVDLPDGMMHCPGDHSE